MRTMQDLKQLQALPLDLKVRLTKRRIRDWVNEYGEDGVYISFSGGKDSTVLLHLVREEYPNIPAVFVDTGLEYPEIRQFVKNFDNVEWLKPKMNFRQVIEKYGYPMFSKEVCETVYGARRYLAKIDEKPQNLTDRQIYWYRVCDLYGIERRRAGVNKLCEQVKYGTLEESIRVQMLNGTFKNKDDTPNRFNKTKYRFMLDCPWEISNKCCNIMKKNPVHKYSKETRRFPMTAQMAEESKLRTQKWLKNGCNGFAMRKPISNPMSFWTEQDVLLYIYQNNIPICSVYGDVVKVTEMEGQLDMEDVFGKDICDMGTPVLKTTGCKRTGCMFCGYGCHLEKPGEGRFERMKVTHPKQYEYIMKPWEEGGLNYKAVIDWLNENGKLHIRY